MMDKKEQPLDHRTASAPLEKKSTASRHGFLLRGLHSFRGAEILNRILKSENPGQLVQELSSEDFYWLMKKIGEEDCPRNTRNDAK